MVREHSIQFDPNLVIGPDWDFWIQIAVHGRYGYLDKMTCLYRVHNSNITKRIDMEKRKRDQAFGRLKVMSAAWFNDLSMDTRDRFFTEFLVNIVSGDTSTQTKILASEQFSQLPADVRSRLWRVVGINVWQCERNAKAAKKYFYESQKLNPNDRKTRFIVRGLGWAPWPTLQLTIFWQRLIHIVKWLTLVRYARSKRLQRLFGFK